MAESVGTWPCPLSGELPRCTWKLSTKDLILCTAPELADSSKSDCHRHHFGTTALTLPCSHIIFGGHKSSQSLNHSSKLGEQTPRALGGVKLQRPQQASVTSQTTGSEHRTQKQPPERLTSRGLDQPGTRMAANHLLTWPLRAEHIPKQCSLIRKHMNLRCKKTNRWEVSVQTER